MELQANWMCLKPEDTSDDMYQIDGKEVCAAEETCRMVLGMYPVKSVKLGVSMQACTDKCKIPFGLNE